MTHRHFGIEPRFAPQPLPSAARSATSAVKASPRAEVATNSTVPASPGGIRRSPVRHSAGGTRADPLYVPLPSGSLADPGGYSLESHDVADTDRDRIAMIGGVSFALFVCAFFFGLRALSVYFFG